MEIQDWDERISRFADSTFFHSANWARVLHSSYHYSPEYLVAGGLDNPKLILPVMGVKGLLSGVRGVSLPFTDFCEPLLSRNLAQEEFTATIKKVTQDSGWTSLQIRGGQQFMNGAVPATSYYGHQLELARPEQELKAGLRNSLKRNIKRAQNEGVKVIIDNSDDALRAFYHLNCLTRKKHGLPPQPFRFFENIQKHVLHNHLGTLFLARYNCQTVAAAIYFHQFNKVIYKFGASDEKYLQVRANNLIMWEAIKHFNATGYELFDFGKTELTNEGLRRYKLSYGAEERTINYYRYEAEDNAFVKQASRESGWHNQVFKRMPVPVLRLSGSLLYKHVA